MAVTIEKKKRLETTGDRFIMSYCFGNVYLDPSLVFVFFKIFVKYFYLCCCYLFGFNLMKSLWKCQEKDARDIEIPNIRWDVFELMMRLVTGSLLSCHEKNGGCLTFYFVVQQIHIHRLG